MHEVALGTPAPRPLSISSAMYGAGFVADTGNGRCGARFVCALVSGLARFSV